MSHKKIKKIANKTKAATLAIMKLATAIITILVLSQFLVSSYLIESYKLKSDKRVIISPQDVEHLIKNFNDNTLNANGVIVYIYQPVKKCNYKEMSASFFDEKTSNTFLRTRTLKSDGDIMLSLQEYGYCLYHRYDSDLCENLKGCECIIILPIKNDGVIIGEAWGVYTTNPVPLFNPQAAAKELGLLSRALN